MSNRVMTLDDALRAIEGKAFLSYADDEHLISIWSPHSKLPIGARRSIVKHREQLLTMMSAGDIRTCPARSLHRQYYRFAGDDRYVCELCQRIDASI